MKFKEKLKRLISESKKLTKKDITKMAKNGEDISEIVVSHIKDFSGMFKGLKNFNQEIGEWDMSNAVDTSSMFEGCRKFNQDLADWDVDKVKKASKMFYDCDKMSFDNVYEWDWEIEIDDYYGEDDFTLSVQLNGNDVGEDALSSTMLNDYVSDNWDDLINSYKN